MKEWEEQAKNRFRPTWTEDKSAREDRFEYKQAQQLVKDGVALAKEGKHEEALKVYREALALDPIHAVRFLLYKP